MSARRARLAVVLAAALGISGAPPPAGAHTEPPPVVLPAAPGGEPDTQVVDLTFPTDPGATFSDTYDAPRSGGRRHRATDLMGDKLWPVHAAVGGEVTWIPGADGSPMPVYGYMVRIAGDDGRAYSYVHLNNDTPGTDDGAGGSGWAYAPGLRPGSRVERGEWIGYVGDSGNAEETPPHLHFEIEDPAVTDRFGGHRLDPYRSLRAALDRGDVPDPLGPGRPPPGSPADEGIRRVAGDDRVGTAARLAAEHGPADVAVVTSAETAADALTAAPLAAARSGPVLTTWADRLDPRVADALGPDGLDVRSVIVVGGPAAVSPDVEAALRRLGVDVERLYGRDRFATGAAVAHEVWAAGPAGPRRAVVALGSHPDPSRAWPDALTAGWLGARTGAPVLLVDPGGVPDPTRAALAGVEGAIVVGGEAAVAPATASALAGPGRRVARLAGDDRYATAAAVASHLVAEGLASASPAWLASGRAFADALAATPVVSRTGGVLLLVDGDGGGGDATAAAWLAARPAALDGLEGLRLVGGPTAIGEGTRLRLAERLAPRP